MVIFKSFEIDSCKNTWFAWSIMALTGILRMFHEVIILTHSYLVSVQLLLSFSLSILSYACNFIECINLFGSIVIFLSLILFLTRLFTSIIFILIVYTISIWTCISAQIQTRLNRWYKWLIFSLISSTNLIIILFLLYRSLAFRNMQKLI